MKIKVELFNNKDLLIGTLKTLKLRIQKLIRKKLFEKEKTILSENYAIDKNNVYSIIYGKKLVFEIIKNADPASFRLIDFPKKINHLEKIYAKDKNNIYLYGAIIKDANLKTFKPLNSLYSKDKNSVFCYGKKIDADLKTFKIEWYVYAKDKNNIYYCGEIIKDADPKTFKIECEVYAKDKNNTYHFGEVEKT